MARHVDGVSCEWVIVSMGCRVNGCHFNGVSRQWDVMSVVSHVSWVSCQWDVTLMGCRVAGMSCQWDITSTGCCVNGMPCQSDVVSMNCLVTVSTRYHVYRIALLTMLPCQQAYLYTTNDILSQRCHQSITNWSKKKHLTSLVIHTHWSGSLLFAGILYS